MNHSRRHALEGEQERPLQYSTYFLATSCEGILDATDKHFSTLTNLQLAAGRSGTVVLLEYHNVYIGCSDAQEKKLVERNKDVRLTIWCRRRGLKLGRSRSGVPEGKMQLIHGL